MAVLLNTSTAPYNIVTRDNPLYIPYFLSPLYNPSTFIKSPFTLHYIYEHIYDPLLSIIHLPVLQPSFLSLPWFKTLPITSTKSMLCKQNWSITRRRRWSWRILATVAWLWCPVSWTSHPATRAAVSKKTNQEVGHHRGDRQWSPWNPIWSKALPKPKEMGGKIMPNPSERIKFSRPQNFGGSSPHQFWSWTMFDIENIWEPWLRSQVGSEKFTLKNNVNGYTCQRRNDDKSWQSP